MNETLLLFALFLVLSLLGVPVAFALSLAGSIGICALLGFGKLVATLPYIFYGSLNSFTLIAIPLYVLMGNIIIRGKLSEEMYAVFNGLFGHLPGGLAIITCLFCGVFAAISGSSVATAATVGMLVLPEMIRLGYERKFVYGLIASSGTLGILIPPSLNFLLYGALTEVSVGKLFIAGIIPGIVLCSMFLAYGLIFSFAKKYRFGGEQIGWKDKLVLLKRSFWSFFVIPFILIGIYKGIFTPTEAAGIGVVYALFVCLIKKTLPLSEFSRAILDSLKTSCMILMIVVGAAIFGYIVTVLQFPQQIVKLIVEHNVTQFQFLLYTFLLILFLGCFVECVTIMVLLTPILYPIILNLRIDPIWFGVFLTVNMELALITPPVGLNLFVIQSISAESKLEDIYRGIWPFILIMIGFLAILYFYPEMATYLPAKMKGG
jgi:C4-dicarboxylate transporter DctM subunit